MKNRLVTMAHKYSELIRYGIVGGLNTSFGIVFFWLLQSVFNIQYLIANITTWVVGILLSFFANKHFVFMKTGKSNVADEMSLFVATRIGAGVVDMALIYVMVEVICFPAFPSKCINTLIIAVLNYVTAKLIVFRKSANMPSED